MDKNEQAIAIQNPGTGKSFLEFLPVSFFGGIMGLTALSFCWGWAEKTWGSSAWIKDITGVLAIVLFIILTTAYLLKIWKYPFIVKAELQHPVSVCFFTTFIVSLLLLPGIILPYCETIAIAMWCVGAISMLFFVLFVLKKWFSNQQEYSSAAPAWFLPIVGTLDVPVVGYRLPVEGIHEICLFFFGVGLLFAIIFSAVIISRLLFQPLLAEAVQPTFMIMVAPFALAYSAYEALPGYSDIAGGVFFYFALFALLLFGGKIMLLPKCCPFRVTWWAVSFPLVAITIASFHYATHKHSALFQVVPAVLITVSTLTITYLLLQTFYRLLKNKLFLVDPVSEKATALSQPKVALNAL